MSKYSVTQCICHDRSFQEIKEYSSETGYSTVEELQEDEFCSCQCQFCVPYIEMMLETGETEFEPGAYLSRN